MFMIIRCKVPNSTQYRSMLDMAAGRLPDRSITGREYAYRRELTLQKINGIEYVVKTDLLNQYIDEHGLNNQYSCPKICHAPKLFQALFDAHVGTGHAATERTYKTVCMRYCNVSREMVKTFYSLCPTCVLTKMKPARKANQEPILSKTFNDRGQIDLIDMQSIKDGPFNWILHYQDHLTKFTYLRPLRKKSKLSLFYLSSPFITKHGHC